MCTTDVVSEPRSAPPPGLLRSTRDRLIALRDAVPDDRDVERLAGLAGGEVQRPARARVIGGRRGRAIARGVVDRHRAARAADALDGDRHVAGVLVDVVALLAELEQAEVVVIDDRDVGGVRRAGRRVRRVGQRDREVLVVLDHGVGVQRDVDGLAGLTRIERQRAGLGDVVVGAVVVRRCAVGRRAVAVA